MKIRSLLKTFGKDNAGFMQTIGTLIALLVVIAVGAMIFFEVTDSFEGGSDEANTTIDDTQSMGETIFGLLPIIALVVVASLIIGVVAGMGGGFSRGGL